MWRSGADCWATSALASADPIQSEATMNPVHCKAAFTQMVDSLATRSSTGNVRQALAAGPLCCIIAANSTKLGVDPTGHVS
jgi:hypothetical protein